jgi:hypothetical protein
VAARRVGSLIRQSEGVQHTAARAYYILLAVIGLPINRVDERIGLLALTHAELREAFAASGMLKLSSKSFKNNEAFQEPWK